MTLMHHIFRFNEIHLRAKSPAGKSFGADDKIDALHNQLVIFLLSTLNWRCRLAYKVVWGRHQLRVEIDFWRNKALLVKNVQVRSTDEFDHSTSRECRKASVQTGIVPTDCGDTHVPGNVFCPSVAQETRFLDLLAEV